MRPARWLVLAGVVVLGACQDVVDPNQPDSFQASVQQGQGDEMSALARAVPAFGGFFFDEAGRPTAWLTDLGQAPALRARIGGLSAMRGHSAEELVILHGNFPYTQLEDAFSRSTYAAFALEGTVFTDLDETKNQVVVGVERAALVNGARSVLARAGLAPGSYDVIVSDPIYQLTSLQERFVPTIGGIQIHFTRYLCTLGVNATVSGERSFITNSHCTAKQGGVENTAYYQPTSSADGNVIAYENADPAYFTGGVCPKGKACRYSDSSRAEYTAGRSSTLGTIAFALEGKPTLDGTVAIQGVNPTTQLAKNTVVNKVGRTTGWTRGTVQQTCANIGVSGSKIVQLCQTLVTSASQIVGGGDSGSAVWTGGKSGATLVGLLWGGNTSGTQFVFSPWSAVVTDLGGDVVVMNR